MKTAAKVFGCFTMILLLLTSCAPSKITSDWKSDTYTRIRLEYILNLTVLDGKGMLLAKKEITGDENLGGAGFNTLSTTRKKVPAAFKEKMEELFNAPEIVKALEL